MGLQSVFVQRMGISLWAAILFLGVLRAQSTPVGDIVYQVQFVQADVAARDALSNERARADREFQRPGRVQVHVLGEATDLPKLVAEQRGRETLEDLSTMSLYSKFGRDAQLLIGGRYPLPTTANEGGSQRAPGAGPSRPATVVRELGLRMNLRGVTLPDGRLRVRVRLRTRSVDFSKATVEAESIVPAVTVGGGDHYVDVKPGQSFVITGWMTDAVRRQLERVPELQSRSLMKAILDRQAGKPNTSLVLLVTPRLLSGSSGV